jgi:hypothetical protein
VEGLCERMTLLKAHDFPPVANSGRFWKRDGWRTVRFTRQVQTKLWDEPIVSRHVA